MFNRGKTQTTARPGLPAPAILMRGAVVLALMGGLYALYNIIWMAVSAALGLAAIAGIAAVGFGFISMLPLLGQKLENWILARRKAEARANPVEQLQNLYLVRIKQVEAQRTAAIEMNAQIRTMDGMITDRRAMNKDVSQQTAALGALKVALQQRIEKIKLFEKALVQMKDKIEDVEYQQKFAKVYAAAHAAGGSAEDEATNQMLAQEAINSSDESFNKIFADLDIETATLNDTKQIEYGGATIDLTKISAPTIQHAGRV